MSAIAYGLITDQQQRTPTPATQARVRRSLDALQTANLPQADKERITQELEAQAGAQAAPSDAAAALTSALVALFPAEALAVYNLALQLGVGVNVVDQGTTQQLVVDDPPVATAVVVVCIAVALGAYLATKIRGPWTNTDYIRMLIPPAAAAAWLGLQQPSILYALDFGMVGSDWIRLGVIIAGVVAVFAAAALGVTAKNQESPANG